MNAPARSRYKLIRDAIKSVKEARPMSWKSIFVWIWLSIAPNRIVRFICYSTLAPWSAVPDSSLRPYEPPSRTLWRTCWTWPWQALGGSGVLLWSGLRRLPDCFSIRSIDVWRFAQRVPDSSPALQTSRAAWLSVLNCCKQGCICAISESHQFESDVSFLERKLIIETFIVPIYK